MIAEGECSFEELVAQNKMNLAGADLTRADLSGVDFTGADLAGANLTRAIIIGADFTGAVLTRAVGLGTLADEVMELRSRVAELEARGTTEPVGSPAHGVDPAPQDIDAAIRRRELLRLAEAYLRGTPDRGEETHENRGRRSVRVAKAALAEIEEP